MTTSDGFELTEADLGKTFILDDECNNSGEVTLTWLGPRKVTCRVKDENSEWTTMVCRLKTISNEKEATA